jgi:hypothetical protein
MKRKLITTPRFHATADDSCADSHDWKCRSGAFWRSLR